MKIGIMSDSHGQEKAVKIAVEKMGAVDLWIHCGDHDKDSLLLRTGAVKEVIAVQGNCDYHSCYKVDEFIEIAGKKIWITHGHQYKIKNSKLELLWWAKQYEVDIVIYGHTHIAENVMIDNVVLFNPGSVVSPRQGKPSCGLLEINKEIVKFEIIQL